MNIPGLMSSTLSTTMKSSNESKKDAQKTKHSKTIQAWHDESDIENGMRKDKYSNTEEVMKIFKALQFSMALLGMYNYTKETMVAKDIRTKWCPSKAAIYNIIVLVWIWGYLIRCVVTWFVVDMGDEYMMLKVIPIAWCFQIGVNVYIMLKHSHPRFGSAQDGQMIWYEHVLPLIEELHLDLRMKATKRHVIAAILVGWSVVVFSGLGGSFLLIYPHTSISTLMTNLTVAPLPINIGTRIFTAVTIFYLTAGNLLPVVYVVVVCVMFKFVFKISRQAVEEANERKSDDSSTDCSKTLHRQRLLHLHVCHAVEHFDKEFRYFFANTFFSVIPMSCFYIFQLLKTDMDVLSIMVHVFWLMFGLVSMTVVCVYAATLNKAAHAPLHCLYQTQMTDVSLDQLGQINLFVSKLTASPIGFSILDFFVITRELILTVGGIFLTYSVVLLQF